MSLAGGKAKESMDIMAQEALRRAREMQSKTGAQNNGVQKHTESRRQEDFAQRKSEPDNQNEVPRSPLPFLQNEDDSRNNKNMPPEEGKGIFDIFLKDKDRTIILILIILIYDESNLQTLLALMYLLI